MNDETKNIRRQNADSTATTSRFAQVFANYAVRYPKLIFMGWGAVLLVFVAVLPVAYVCWGMLVPKL